MMPLCGVLQFRQLDCAVLLSALGRSRLGAINWTAEGTIKGNAIPFSGRSNKGLSNGARAREREEGKREGDENRALQAERDN